MVVPTGTTVTLDIRSQDVGHAWWIPELGGKADATPGYVNHTWFKVPTSALEGKDAAGLPRPVRRALRPQPREHDRPGAGGAPRRSSSAGSTASAPTWIKRSDAAAQRYRQQRDRLEAAQDPRPSPESGSGARRRPRAGSGE